VSDSHIIINNFIYEKKEKAASWNWSEVLLVGEGLLTAFGRKKVEKHNKPVRPTSWQNAVACVCVGRPQCCVKGRIDVTSRNCCVFSVLLGFGGGGFFFFQRSPVGQRIEQRMHEHASVLFVQFASAAEEKKKRKKTKDKRAANIQKWKLERHQE
jgi:hypothetical protein